MKVLIIDNYDSFTYNLYQYVGEILEKRHKPFVLDVVRNDQLTLEQIKETNYDKIIISPGPGDPSDKAYFGVCSEVLLELGKSIPVLGVCLGMQGMAHYYGGKVIRAHLPMHGKTSCIKHDENGVFKDLPQGIEVMRYHSLVVDPLCLPECFVVTASVGEGADYELMGIRHKTFPLEGIQFHPESFATEGGKQMLRAFLL